jgi:putative DNA primase/helicase
MTAEIIRLGAGKGGQGGADAGRDYPGLEGIRALGFAGDGYYYHSPVTQQVVRLTPSDHNEANLIRLRPLGWWRELYPSQGKGGVDWSKIRDELMDSCHLVGPWSADIVRGRGLWWDDKLGAILHQGDLVHVGGAAYQPSRAPLKHVYEAREPWSGMASTPLPEGGGQRLLDICEMLPWVRPRSAELLAGWMVTAIAAGGLDWRPHLWMTGPAGAGKSWIIRRVILPMLGRMALSVEGETTEAGLRQTIGSDARPVVFDEAEAERRSGQQRIDRIMAMARYMSSAAAGRVVKGGSSHHAASFTGVASMLLASINVGISRQADETRWTVVELAQAHDEQGQAFAALRDAVRGLDDEFRAGLLGSVIAHLSVLRANHRALAAAIAKRLGARLGDQLGAIMAGAALLRSYDRLSEADCEAMAEDLPVEIDDVAHIETDQERCLAAIASFSVRVDTGGKRQVTRMLGHLAAMACGAAAIDEEISLRDIHLALERHGIVVRSCRPWFQQYAVRDRRAAMRPEWEAWIRPLYESWHDDGKHDGKEPRFVTIANRFQALSDILKDSDFAASWPVVLKRLPGAIVYPHGSLNFGAGVKQRCVCLPAELFRLVEP